MKRNGGYPNWGGVIIFLQRLNGLNRTSFLQSKNKCDSRVRSFSRGETAPASSVTYYKAKEGWEEFALPLGPRKIDKS